MHLDVTPAILLPERLERTSLLFHSKPEDPAEPKQRLLANPFGLAEWFKARTPADIAFGEFFEKRSLEKARLRAFAKNETERSEEHTSELQSLMRISYAVFCLKKKNKNKHNDHNITI